MLLRGTLIVSALTLLSRVLGFVRDLLVARLLGASLFADAFFVAFRIPNLLRSFVAEGALTSAFVPIFTSSRKEGDNAARETFRRISSFLLLATSILTAAGCLWAEDVVLLLAPGFLNNPSQFELCVTLTRIMMPYIICVSFIAMINSALNVYGIFGASAWAQVLMNLVLIVGATVAGYFDTKAATHVLAWSVLAGGVFQVLMQLPACGRVTLSLVPSLSLFSADVIQLLKLMGPAIIGASIYQLIIFFGTVLASLAEPGSVSWLFYADRVAQFPMGVFSIALASVLLPTLAKNAHSSADSSTFSDSLATSIRYTSAVILPMSVMIFALAHPIVQLLFERGAFSSVSTAKTAAALKAMTLGLWFASVHSMIVRAFIAKKDTTTPTLIGLATLIVFLLCALTTMGAINSNGTGLLEGFLGSLQQNLFAFLPFTLSLGHVGLALSSSVSAVMSLVLAVVMYERRLGTFPWRLVNHSTGRSLIASLVMYVGVQCAKPVIDSPVLSLVVLLPSGCCLYLGCLSLLRSQELLECRQAALRALRK